MDELAKRLSIISFGVIGVICLIGVFQHRSWLEMFTIGGQSSEFGCFHGWYTDRKVNSVSGGRCDPGGVAYCRHGHIGLGCIAHGQAKGHREEVT